MFRLLLTRLLRQFIVETFTPAFFERILNHVFDQLKKIAPDSIDALLDKVDKAALAQQLIDLVLNLILPALPAVVGGDNKPVPAAGVVAVDEADKDLAEIVAKVNASIAAR